MVITFADLVPLISAGISALSVFFVIKNYKRADIKDIQQRAKEDATVNVKLDTISTTLIDIKYDISTTKKEVASLSEKVATIEQSTKSAHHRIDNLMEQKGK